MMENQSNNNALKADINSDMKSPFYPILILMAAILVWGGFQFSNMYKVRSQLKQQYTAQEPIMNNAEKMRAQLDGMALDIAKLAQGGNSNAQIIVSELNKRGITINQ